jgi:hypothetical protein
MVRLKKYIQDVSLVLFPYDLFMSKRAEQVEQSNAHSYIESCWLILTTLDKILIILRNNKERVQCASQKNLPMILDIC